MIWLRLSGCAARAFEDGEAEFAGAQDEDGGLGGGGGEGGGHGGWEGRRGYE